ncbi:MAG: amidase family protein [Candidatus Izemoplasma sp.]
MYDVVEKSIKEITEALNNGAVTSVDLVKTYLKRIKEIDQGLPFYNSVRELNEDALKIAGILDNERVNGKVRSKMHGIPILLKDNINTLGKMHTTAGSLALKDNYANYDATIVKNLVKNGAIILGKANLTEFANFMTYDMRNGYSSLGKEVLCPYNIKIDPSGSSAGSAVSVSLNLAPVSIGTETGGSIMSPAMQNGVVGIKPTMGLVSRYGIIPISKTLDTAGPIAKSVSDAAILLSSIRSNDVNDSVTLDKKDATIDYSRYLNIDGLKDKRIGIDKTRYNNLSDIRKATFDKNVKLLKTNGAIIVEDLNIKQTDLIFHVMKYEFKHEINRYLDSLGENTVMKSLNDIVKFNKDNKESCLKYGQILLEECNTKTSGNMDEEEYIKGMNEREISAKALDVIFEKNNLDMIYFASYTSLGPHCGFPTLTLPCGIDESNIPIGTYFLAQRYREDKLISISYAFEQIINKRINPLKKVSK